MIVRENHLDPFRSWFARPSKRVAVLRRCRKRRDFAGRSFCAPSRLSLSGARRCRSRFREQAGG